MSSIRFGDYLTQLLHERECSGSRLATMLSIDPALVYRWLHNKAIPKLDTAYCDEIAFKLHLSQAELSQLKEAQIFSLSRPMEQRPRTRHDSAAVERLLRQAAPRPQANGSSTAALSSLQPLAARPSGVIWGRPAILEAIISLLEALAPLPPHQNNTVMLTFQGAQDAYSDFPELQDRYMKALQSVLQRGWQVCHLWRIDQDIRRSILLVENILRLLGTGRYFPYYMNSYGTLAPPYDLLIVPKTAAMLFFATQNPRRADAALLAHDLEQIELFHTHFDQLYAMSQPLTHIYLPEDGANIWQAYADAEDQPGGRLAVKDGFTFLTEPPAWYRQGALLAQVIAESGVPLNAALECQFRRQTAFQANVAVHPYRDICARRGIERLIHHGEAPRNDRLPPGFTLSEKARRQQLEYAIHLLRTHEHYELAIIDEEEEQFVPSEMFWEVAGQHTALMLSWSTDRTGKDIMIELVINESTIVHAFHDYFTELWERIAPEHKDKAHIIAWLEQQLDLLGAATR
ncbi:MAG TPA: hypothetical protein VH599_12855 [Ktedonobacterales bacterium]